MGSYAFDCAPINNGGGFLYIPTEHYILYPLILSLQSLHNTKLFECASL